MSIELPDPLRLSELSRPQLAEVLEQLFERCASLSDFLIDNVFSKNKSFSTYNELIRTCRDKLLTFLTHTEEESTMGGRQIDPRVSRIISAHPRLGPQPVNQEKLSSYSASEQKSLATASKEEAAKLVQMNELYEKTFPGLRYIVFVNGRPRQAILDNMAYRINRNDISAERREALNAMCDIALDRVRKLGAKL